jgi:hypothetical protein
MFQSRFFSITSFISFLPPAPSTKFIGLSQAEDAEDIGKWTGSQPFVHPHVGDWVASSSALSSHTKGQSFPLIQSMGAFATAE